MLKLFLFPIAILFYSISIIRNFLYKNGILKSIKLKNMKVVSVGNLTMGGTGKTPFVNFLIQSLQEKQKKIAVISRAYKANLKGDIHKVNSLIDKAEDVGDEVLMLSQKNPEIDFYSTNNKAKAASHLDTLKNYDVLIVDDGFQHLKLKRDLDFVLVDSTENNLNYLPIPMGRAREGFKALQRANLMVLTKVGAAKTNQINTLEWKAKDLGVDTIQIDYQLDSCFRLMDKKEFKWEELKNKKVFCFCAIGNPETFYKQLSEKMNVVGKLFANDHAPITQGVLHKLEKEMGKCSAEILVCTEKDMVKLKNKKISKPSFYTTQSLYISQGNEKLNEILGSIVS